MSVTIEAFGTITDASTLSPNCGGKPFRYAVTLESGALAYVFKNSSMYLDIYEKMPDIAGGIETRFSRNASVGDTVRRVQYIVWNGKNVITTIDFER